MQSQLLISVKAGKRELVCVLMELKGFRNALVGRLLGTRQRHAHGNFAVAALIQSKISTVFIAKVLTPNRAAGMTFMIHLRMISRRHHERPNSPNARGPQKIYVL